MYRICLPVGPILRLCQKAIQTLVCGIVNLLISKTKYLFSSGYPSWILHRKWNKSSPEHRFGIGPAWGWADQRREVHGRQCLACPLGL